MPARRMPGGAPAHGEPSWSFLYRHVIEVLVDHGTRCVAPDMVGFGRSDKPVETGDYSFARLVEWTRGLDHPTIRDAGHFLQEDAGAELGQVVADFVLGPRQGQ